jgi:hypothetical protein
MKILLLRPPYARRSYLHRFALTEALTEVFLAPALRDEHDCRVVDMRLRPDLMRELAGFVPDAAIVSVMHLSHGSLDAVLGGLKQRFPGLRVLLVGAADYGVTHLTERPEDYAHPLADALVPAYYIAALKRVVPRVLSSWEHGDGLSDIPGLWWQDHPGHWRREAGAINVVGDCGVPDRTLLGRARGRYSLGGIGRMAYLMHTDGCRHACRYCTMSKADGTLFSRRLPDVIEELHGITEPHVFLADFEPLQAPLAMQRLADSIDAERIRKKWYLLTRADSVLNHGDILEHWKELGLTWVYLGIDGHSAERMRQIGKGSSLAVAEAAVARLRRMGLCVSAAITVPSDATREDFAALRAAATRMHTTMMDFTVETPLVGTRYFDESEGSLTTRDWSLFDMTHAVLPTRLPLEDFYRELTRLHLHGWALSGRAAWRFQPMRDLLRNALLGPGAMLASWRSARDHAVHAPRLLGAPA